MPQALRQLLACFLLVLCLLAGFSWCTPTVHACCVPQNKLSACSTLTHALTSSIYLDKSSLPLKSGDVSALCCQAKPTAVFSHSSGLISSEKLVLGPAVRGPLGTVSAWFESYGSLPRTTAQLSQERIPDESKRYLTLQVFRN